jgi:hypothetical protein
MCPLALIQIGLVSILSGEVSEIYSRWDEIVVSSAPQVILFSGLLSFSMNVSSFIANKVTSPLTLCIAANVKQVCNIYFIFLYISLDIFVSVDHYFVHFWLIILLRCLLLVQERFILVILLVLLTLLEF